jgi:hypothetical protein
MMNYLRKPLFSFLTIGLLATACDGGTLLEAPSIVAEPVVSPAAPGIQAADPTVNTPVVEMPAPLPVEAAPVEEVPAPVVADDEEDDEISEPVEAANTETTESSAAATPTGTVDADGDGFFADDSDSTKIDCDDTRKLVNPGMPRDCSKVTKNPANGITSVNTEDYASIDNDCDSAGGTIAANIDEEGECAAATFKKGGRGNPRDGGASPSDSTPGDADGDDAADENSHTQGQGIERPDASSITAINFRSKIIKGNDVATIDKPYWGSLAIQLTFTDEKRIYCPFEGNIPFPNNGDVFVKTGEKFDFTLATDTATLDKCETAFPDKNTLEAADRIAHLQPKQIQDVRLTSHAHVNIGIEQMAFDFVLSTADETAESKIVKAYKNDSVYTYLQYEEPRGVTFPNILYNKESDCAGDAIYNGFHQFTIPENKDGSLNEGAGKDVNGIPADASGNAVDFLPVVNSIVFSRQDIQFKGKLITGTKGLDSGSSGLLNWLPEKYDDCRHQSVNLFAALWEDSTYNFNFYLNGAVTTADIADGGLLCIQGTDEIRLTKTYIKATTCWSDNGLTRKSWTVDNDDTIKIKASCHEYPKATERTED